MKALLSKVLLGVCAASMVVVTGCARDMNSNVYSSSAPVGKVLEGTVLSARGVTIKNTDKLEDNTLGMLGGGLLGGIAGSTIGKGSGQALAVAGVAIAGAAAGALAQDKLGGSNGMEYVVRLDPKYVTQAPQNVSKKNITIGNNSIDDDVKGSIGVANTQTDLLSVVQGTDVILQPGQRVLIIYNNDRPRLVASN